MADEFPDGSVQWITGSWWQESSDLRLCKGRLIFAFAPFVDAGFWILDAHDRSGDGTNHAAALYRVTQGRVQDSRRLSNLPVAALPFYPGEVYGVYRTKRRPLVVISDPLPALPRKLTVGSPNWQTASVVLCVPAFGVERTEKRAGWPEALVQRIQRAEYPNYVWDRLPEGGLQKGSIVRLDQACAIGTGSGSYEPSKWVLNASGLELFSDWIAWYLSGASEPSGELLSFARAELLGSAVT